MKRGAPDHPKFRRLASILQRPRFQVVGIMESLYHFTANYAKRGDIGKWSNAEIAAGIEWDGDPEKLVSALVECRLLDEDPAYRLLVHDWQSHADQTVARSDEVKKLGFASCSLANASQPKPKTMPVAEPKPETTPALASKRPVFVKPSLEEVQAYCVELQSSVNPQQFLDYYIANGWKVGRNPMKDWRATFRNWGRNGFRKETGKFDEPDTPAENPYKLV